MGTVGREPRRVVGIERKLGETAADGELRTRGADLPVAQLRAAQEGWRASQRTPDRLVRRGAIDGEVVAEILRQRGCTGNRRAASQCAGAHGIENIESHGHLLSDIAG